MAQSYSEFVVPLLRSLRPDIMAAYGKVEHELKEDLSVVTMIDKQVEQKIIDALSAEFPDIGFHGEEHGRQGNQDKYWLIDPIDGTENYVRGMPGVTSIIGLVEYGEVVQCYIYDPVEDLMYSAFKDMGAYVDDEKIKISDRTLNRSFVIISNTVTTTIPDFAGSIKKAGANYVGQMYGSGIKAAYMASGKIDGLVTHTPVGGGPWDFAPGAFLAKEAGAILTYFDAGGIESRSYSLFNPKINDTLVSIIERQLK